MQRILCFLIALLFGVRSVPAKKEEVFVIKTVVQAEAPYLRGVWLSQFDLQPLFRDGNRQREEEEFRSFCEGICETLCKDGFNTVFLQFHPNGDSFFESELFPLSKYVAGAYGGTLEYDALGVLIGVLKEAGISVHGWLNPLRLMWVEEIKKVPAHYPVKQWYKKQNGYVKEVDGMLYFDPSYPEVRKLIADGAAEFCRKYNPDGIHIDDYFYPTAETSFDRKEFTESGHDDLSAFRVANITSLVRALHETAKKEGVVFGVSPAGNLDSLKVGYFADAEAWCREGDVDYILPQLYYGFENEVCPFAEMLVRWAGIERADGVELYIGLTAAKAAEAAVDVFAGKGKNEWLEKSNILAKSIGCIYKESRAAGYCFFSYSWLYDRFTGEVHPGLTEEYAKLAPLLRQSNTLYAAALPFLPHSAITSRASKTWMAE